MLTMRLPWEDAFGALISRCHLAIIASLSQSDPVWIPPLVNTGCGGDVTIRERAKLVWMEPRTSHWGFALEDKGRVSLNILGVGLSTADSNYKGAFIKGLVALMAGLKAIQAENCCIQVEDDEIKVTRIAEPVMKVNENVIDVNYVVFIEVEA